MIDRCTITDPPEYATRYEADDLPEALGDDFELSVEEKARIHRAAHPNIVAMALAGDKTGFEAMRRLHVVRWEHDRQMSGEG